MFAHFICLILENCPNTDDIVLKYFQLECNSVAEKIRFLKHQQYISDFSFL